MAGDWRAVLDPWLAVLGWWEVQQHREAARAFHQRADSRVAETQDQVAFPVAGNGPVPSLCGPLADHHLLGHELLATRSNPCPGDPKRPARAQARDELTLQRAAALDEQRLIDRLVADPHRLIIGEVDLQSVRDLLRAPRHSPAPVLAARLVSPFPRRCLWPSDSPVRPPHLAGESRLHILTQPRIGGELRGLRTPRQHLRLPLRDRRPVLKLATTRGHIPAQLPRDRRRRTTKPTRDRPNPDPLRSEQRDLLPLLKR